MTYLSLITFAAETDTTTWIAIISAVLGPTGAAGIFKWWSEHKDAIIQAKDKQIEDLRNEREQAVQREQSRTDELLAEARQVAQALAETSRNNRESAEVMEKVLRRLEADERVNQQEIEVLRGCSQALAKAESFMTAFAARHGLQEG